jgi:hypothetical protein
MRPCFTLLVNTPERNFPPFQLFFPEQVRSSPSPPLMPLSPRARTPLLRRTLKYATYVHLTGRQRDSQ